MSDLVAKLHEWSRACSVALAVAVAVSACGGTSSVEVSATDAVATRLECPDNVQTISRDVTEAAAGFDDAAAEVRAALDGMTPPVSYADVREARTTDDAATWQALDSSGDEVAVVGIRRLNGRWVTTELAACTP